MTMNRDEMLRDIESETAESMERLRLAADLAKSGLHTLTIVNGGALVALFTLIGTGKMPFATGLLWAAFIAFVLGIAASLVAFLAGHASQNQFYIVSAHRAHNLAAELAGRTPSSDVNGPMTFGNKCLKAAVASSAISIMLFVIGSGLALAAFT